MRPLSITPLLLRGRIRAGSGLIDLLGVLAFTISSTPAHAASSVQTGSSFTPLAAPAPSAATNSCGGLC